MIRPKKGQNKHRRSDKVPENSAAEKAERAKWRRRLTQTLGESELSVNPTIERSKRARSEGRLWRAKEMLQGRISSHPYDAEIMEEYGSVLLEMGDDLEAGKYLFLSGARSPAYKSAINLYLDRFADSTAIHLHASFPAWARKVPLEQFPEPVANELRTRGFKPDDLNQNIREPRSKSSPSRETFGKFGCLAVVALFLLLFGLGVVSGIQRVWQWLG